MQLDIIYGIKFIMLLCLIPNACKLHKSRISHNKIDAANGQIYKQQGVIKRLILIEIDHLLVSLLNVGLSGCFISFLIHLSSKKYILAFIFKYKVGLIVV